MTEAKSDFIGMLRVLVEHEVDFIVVGGVGAVLQGAPISTFDLDLVHSRRPSNVDRLLAALGELDAVYRAQPSRQLRPDATHLGSSGHQLLMTSRGPLDLLGAIGASREYDELRRDAIEMNVSEGLRVWVLKLETLIATKEEAGDEKDRAVLPVLRRTLEEGRRTKSSSRPDKA